jgi:hypothetical protein
VTLFMSLIVCCHRHFNSWIKVSFSFTSSFGDHLSLRVYLLVEMHYREATLLPRWRYSCHLLFAGAGISIHESRFLSPLLPRLGISCRCGFRSVLKPLCHVYVSPGLVGTALTFTTCLGFTITTVSQHSNGGSLVAWRKIGTGPRAMLISPTWRLVRSLEFVDRTKSGLHTCSCKRPWRSKSSTKTKHVVPELSTCHQSTCDPSTFR